MKIIELEQVQELIAYGARASLPPAAVALTVCFANRAHTSSVVDDIQSPDWVGRTLAVCPGLIPHKSYLQQVGEEIRAYWGLDKTLPTTPEVPFATIPSAEIPPAVPTPDPAPAPVPAEPVAAPVDAPVGDSTIA